MHYGQCLASSCRCATCGARRRPDRVFGRLCGPASAILRDFSGRWRARKTIENILLTLCSLLRTGNALEYAAGSKSLSDLTLPHDGVKKEQRCFTTQEIGPIISAASVSLASLRYKALGASPIEALRQLYRLSQATLW